MRTTKAGKAPSLPGGFPAFVRSTSRLVIKLTFCPWCRSPTEVIRPRIVSTQPQWRPGHVVQHLHFLSNTGGDRGNNSGRNPHPLDRFRFEHGAFPDRLRVKITAAGDPGASPIVWKQEGALSGPSCFVACECSEMLALAAGRPSQFGQNLHHSERGVLNRP